MILILGSDHDDIAYIVKTMEVDRIDTVASKYEVHVGRLVGRDIVVAPTGYGQEMATLITGLLIERYSPYIIFSIGSVQSVSENLRRGDLFIASRVYAMDVNLMGLGQYKYGQIPEQPDFFVSDSELRKQVVSHNSINKNKNIVEGILLSSNIFYNNLDEFNEMAKDHFVKVNGICATDTETSGVCCAASIYNIPTLVLKGCSYELDDPTQRVARTRNTILVSPSIGKLIQAIINSLA